MKDRSIAKGHEPQKETMVLEFTVPATVYGVQHEAGETIEVTRAEARSIMRSTPGLKIKVV